LKERPSTAIDWTEAAMLAIASAETCQASFTPDQTVGWPKRIKGRSLLCLNAGDP